MDAFFSGVFGLLVLLLVCFLMAVAISYLYERGIGRPVFDWFLKNPAIKQFQFILVLVVSIAACRLLGLDVVATLAKIAPIISSPSPDASTLISGVVLTILSSWVHNNTGINAPGK